MNIPWEKIRWYLLAAVCAAAAAGSIHSFRMGAVSEGAAVLYDTPEPTGSGYTERIEPEASVTPEETRIDLNSATEEELCSLRGIGPAKAKAILAYRAGYGGFVCIEEIMEVKGIGPGTFENIRDFIYVKDEPEEL